MGQEKKEKLTKMEIDWILYDVGNSAFVLLATTILPIYFNYLAGLEGVSEVDYLLGICSLDCYAAGGLYRTGLRRHCRYEGV
mgnify:CR=1 FL=1